MFALIYINLSREIVCLVTQETTVKVSGGSGSRQGVTWERKVVQHHQCLLLLVVTIMREKRYILVANIGTDRHLTNFLQ